MLLRCHRQRTGDHTAAPACLADPLAMSGSLPAGVKLVLEAVCIMKNIKPVRMKDPNSGRMVDDYWEASKKMLMDNDFLETLRR